MLHTVRTRLVHAACRIWRLPLPRRFLRHDKGSAAVEFGLVAVPFLAMLFAIMETALVFFAGQALETAAADSARTIMTGQAQSQGWSQEDFKRQVCSRVFGLFNCDGGIMVDVRAYANFTDANLAKPIDENGNLQINPSYQPGGPGDIVIVRLMYQWPVYASLLGLNLADMSGNKRLLVATAAFRNEPYQ
jgi:Flp pilus assembly protein TadG